jgi:hypothetical protein
MPSFNIPSILKKMLYFKDDTQLANYTSKVNYLQWAVIGVDAALYLASYEMEAVSFTAFIYYESVRWGIKFLKMIAHNESWCLLQYFSFKFFYGVFYDAYHFHVTFGPLNPFSKPGYDAMFKEYWDTYVKLVTVVPVIQEGYTMEQMMTNILWIEATKCWPPGWEKQIQNYGQFQNLENG